MSNSPYDVMVQVEYCGGKLETMHCLNTDARRLVDAQGTRTHVYGHEFTVTVYGHSMTEFKFAGKQLVGITHGMLR